MANPPPPPPPTLGPGWQGAPPVTKIAAAGTRLWAIGPNNEIYTIFDRALETGGREWFPWKQSYGLDFVREFAATFQQNNLMQCWILDIKHQLRSLRMLPGEPSTTGWQEPSWNNAPTGLQRLAAAQQFVNPGVASAALWAITDDKSLIHCSERLGEDGAWFDWQPWPETPKNSKFVEITAARQNGGAVQFWALDTEQQLWSRYRTSPGEDWSPWSPPNWNGAPRLIKIAACEQGGTRGQQLWGITEDHLLVNSFQVSVGGGWSGWSTGTWLAAPPVKEIAAHMPYFGCARLWAVTLEQKLIGTSQIQPGGDWVPWSPPR